MVIPSKRKFAQTKNPMFVEGMQDLEATISTPIHVEILYVPPRREGAPRVKVSNNQRYIILMPNILAEVIVEGSMLDQILEICFADHVFHNFIKFPYFNPQYYMQLVPTEENKSLELQFQQWALGLEKSGITNLLDIPYFGRGA